VTKETEIGVTWSAGVADGGQPVIDYRIWYNLESESEFIILKSGLTTAAFTTDFTLLAGQNYKFKVQSRNNVGYSLFSSEIIVRAAKVPDAPTDVVTTIDFNEHNVIVSWTEPYAGGSPFTSFTVMIQHSDGITYSQDANLPWAASVYAKVAGVNLVGEGDFSLAGNGAQLVS
jgi:hypothetical protein